MGNIAYPISVAHFSTSIYCKRGLVNSPKDKVEVFSYETIMRQSEKNINRKEKVIMLVGKLYAHSHIIHLKPMYEVSKVSNPPLHTEEYSRRAPHTIRRTEGKIR